MEAAALVVLLASDMGDCVDDDSLITEVMQHAQVEHNQQPEDE